MKFFSILVLATVTLLTGCESVSSRVQDRFSSVTPQSRVYEAERKVVYNAGKVAVKNVGLLLGRTSLSQGIIEAYAPIRSGDATQDARQTTLRIQLAETLAGDTEVSLIVSENTEGSFPGGVSQQDLRAHSLYGLYFAALQQVLSDEGALKVPPAEL